MDNGNHSSHILLKLSSRDSMCDKKRWARSASLVLLEMFPHQSRDMCMHDGSGSTKTSCLPLCGASLPAGHCSDPSVPIWSTVQRGPSGTYAVVRIDDLKLSIFVAVEELQNSIRTFFQSSKFDLFLALHEYTFNDTLLVLFQKVLCLLLLQESENCLNGQSCFFSARKVRLRWARCEHGRHGSRSAVM